MDFKERQMFAQDAFTKLDVLEAEEKSDKATEEVTPGFGRDSE
jgi:hypothetical protein